MVKAVISGLPASLWLAVRGIPNSERDAVRLWAAVLALFPSHELASFDARHRNCSFNAAIDDLHMYGRLQGLFEKARTDRFADQLCKEIEALFILSYVCSAATAVVYGQRSGAALREVSGTLKDFFMWDPRIRHAWRLSSIEIQGNPLIAMARGILEEHEARFDDLSHEEMTRLWVVCYSATQSQYQRVLGTVGMNVFQRLVCFLRNR